MIAPRHGRQGAIYRFTRKAIPTTDSFAGCSLLGLAASGAAMRMRRSRWLSDRYKPIIAMTQARRADLPGEQVFRVGLLK